MVTEAIDTLAMKDVSGHNIEYLSQLRSGDQELWKDNAMACRASNETGSPGVGRHSERRAHVATFVREIKQITGVGE